MVEFPTTVGTTTKELVPVHQKDKPSLSIHFMDHVCINTALPFGLTSAHKLLECASMDSKTIL